ncbi:MULTISPECIES: MFS transporter [Phocaeicola]|jgi:ACS family hexuronate transporter-like MFS transporter|uniref:MFS transporter n=1 Tax=Phocaeicola plebeius TaxID=310297 RepID=A0A3E4Z4Y2_9BACT|nr:MFS transporter [Phocaeicola plebeius]MBS5540792.1 MFS transporter [Phocaeicola plebeius]RGM85433.1 MFS transporter [Phocaeicola plebeius]RHD51170.1 MFS transporter [Phocaeicola plebeius]RHH51955.1 MFS transporter [Phocaeicola plebeius]RHL00859.1 MFS transporter [Phocaeicola plebeius]
MKNSKIYPWIVVGLLWGVALLNYMDRQMLSTMKDAMQVDIVELQSATNFGYLMAIFLWIYALMSPVSGVIADRMSRKWLIVGSLFVWSSVTYLMGIAETFNQIVFLRALMGVSEALYIPAGLSLIADYHTGKSRSLAVGIHMTGLYTGQAIGGFGATVADAFSWHTTFHWFGIIGIAYAVILMLFLHDKKTEILPTEKLQANPQKEKESVFTSLKSLLTNVAFWVILLYFAAPSLPGWATKNWLPTLFAENLDLPMSQAGPISTITIAVSSFIGVLIGGPLSDKWVQKNLRGRVYTGAIGLGLTIPSLLLLGFGHNLVAVVGAGLLFGIGYGIFDTNNMPILCQFVSRKQRATAYGVMNMIGVSAGAFITHLLGRWGDSGNLGAGFAMLAIVVAIALGVQLYFLRPKTDNME